MVLFFKRKFSNIALLFISLLFFSCGTMTPYIEDESVKESQPEYIEEPSPYPSKITMLFAGDIMAHANNFRTGNFDNIWTDISPLVMSADFSFANIEAPVADELEWSSYPEFNMKNEYPEAAINAGFNVFSLINNHTNDKREKGIEATIKWSTEIAEKKSESGRPVYFSGIKQKDEEEFSYAVIEKDEWKILFVAITEILNRYEETEYMNLVRTNEKQRTAFTEKIATLKKENGCNFCVVSVHCNEPEYVRTVTNARKNFYYKLLDSGANVVWANHPHVIQEREFVGTAGNQSPEKLIMYANGNTISGQRRAPNYADPKDDWEWTGDGILVLATFEISEEGAEPKIISAEPHFITSYITTANQIVIKNLDDDFINYLNENERTAWAKYIAERKKSVEQTKEITTWR